MMMLAVCVWSSGDEKSMVTVVEPDIGPLDRWDHAEQLRQRALFAAQEEWGLMPLHVATETILCELQQPQEMDLVTHRELLVCMAKATWTERNGKGVMRELPPSDRRKRRR